MGKIFEMLHGALTDVLEYERGKLKLPVKKVILPGPLKKSLVKKIKKPKSKLKIISKKIKI